ncbi:MAG: hypothetical protein IJ333_03525, partial [Clostridia bacterium]|nr:hypothetical protein [Clostridia bacterium]
NKQYAYDNIVYQRQNVLSEPYEKKHIAILGEQSNLIYYDYLGNYSPYYQNLSQTFEKVNITEENVGQYIEDEAFKNELIKNNLNTFIADNAYVFEQMNGDIFFTKKLMQENFDTVYKLKYVGDIVSTNNESLKNDISAFYSGICSGAEKMPEFKTALNEKLKMHLESRFEYQRDAVKWLGQKIKGVNVSIDHAVKMDDVVFYDAFASFDYHVNGNQTSCCDRIHILIDEKENTIIDWSVRYGGYDFESGRSGFFFADKSTWLQNITVKNVKFEAPVPQNTKVIPATDKTYVCYNKDTISTEIKGLEFDVEYDPQIKNYVIGGGMGQVNAIEKIEVCNRYVKLYFTRGSSLNDWMSWGAITVNKNSKEFKELSSGGKAQYGTHTIYHFDDKRMSFSEKDGQHNLTYTFDEPIPEFITSLDICAGKVD